MSNLFDATKALEQRFVAWANDRDDIRMAVVVGSWARTDHPADEWSDLDVGFGTTNAQRYLSSDDWLSEIATVWSWYPDPVGVTRHVLFEGGLDAGLAPIPYSSVKLAVRFVPILRHLPLALRRGIERELDSAAEFAGRGVRVILDKDGLAPKFFALLPAEERAKAGPSQQAFRDAVSQFWFEAVWCAKHLRRGELWYAKCNACDGQMKSLLLRMMEWHAVAIRGPDCDTWENGRYLEEWGDPAALGELRRAFAHYDEEDIWRALVATMGLFRRLAVETAGRLGYAYPADADEKISEWVTTCMAARRAQDA